MNRNLTIHAIILLVLVLVINKIAAQPPFSDKLHNSVSKELETKDSLIFDIVFHSCNVQGLSAIYAKSFIMLHDNGLANAALNQSYPDFEASIRKMCDDKTDGRQMRRELVKSSVQVFLTGDAEAIQTGIQRFYMRRKDAKEAFVEESKFTRNWRKEQGNWKLYSETDYLVNTQPAATAADRYVPQPYEPVAHALYQTIAKLDSTYFDTYNHSKLAQMDSLTAEDIEFYHDRGGLLTSKKELLASIQKNIFGKVTRTLTPGSMEVYEIPGYGAIEFAYHSFHNVAEPGESHPSEFVILWRLKEGKWQINRVVSLH